MVLDIPGKLLGQSDVRETPISTATATAVGLTDGKYVVLDYHADMTDERKLTAGTAISVTDGGANSTVTIANTGVTSAVSGTGVDVNGATGAVTFSSNDGEIDHDALNNTHNMTTDIDARITAGEGIDYSAGTISGEDSAAGNKGIVIVAGTANEITVSYASGTATLSLTNKTSYLSIPGNQFISYNPDVDDVSIGSGDSRAAFQCNGSMNLTCHVNLPHGAVVTACIVYGNTAATGETWTLYRSVLNDGNVATVSGALASAAVDTADSSIDNATIDNSTYSYSLDIPNMDNGDLIWGAKITYTTDYD